MKMCLALILAAAAGFALTLGLTTASRAEGGWKLCVAQTCTFNRYTHKRQCINKLVECPTPGEHVGTITSNEKGSNW